MRALALAALLFVTACAYSPRVATDFDPAANFAAYRTYSWIPPEVPRGMNPLMFRRVQASIDRALQARGYTQADPGDFSVSFTIGEQERTEVNDYGYWGPGPYGGWGWDGPWGGYGPWGFGGWSRWGGWGPGYHGLDVYTVTDRSIVIDIYDRASNRPVWHGVVTRTGYPDDIDYPKLDQTVDAVLARFPPQPAPAAGAAAAAD
jgi:hypothetical protein